MNSPSKEEHPVRLVLSSLFAAASIVFVAELASAASVVINNGFAPPNPANVINASNSFPGTAVDVQNVGCNVNLIDPCPSPGAPTSVALVTGGVVGGLFEAHETSSITMSGGTAGALATIESSSAMLSGGEAGDLDASGSSVVTMSGGTVRGELGAFDTASITVNGGTAANANVHADCSSSLTITGGTFTGSNLTVGGSLASIKMRGGEGMAQVIADAGSITIFGQGFEVGGIPVGFGVIPFQHGTLTGALGSGETIDAIFSHNGYQGVDNGTITLAFSTVPEPSTALLVTAGVLGLASVRRART